MKHLTCVFGSLLVVGLSAAPSEHLSCKCEVLDNTLKMCRLNQDSQWITWNVDNFPIKDEFGNLDMSIAEGCGESCIKVKDHLSVISVNVQSSDMMENEEVQCNVMEKVILQTEDPGQNAASKVGIHVFILLLILIFYII